MSTTPRMISLTDNNNSYNVNLAAPLFSENYYLANNSDVKTAVASGAYASGWEHWVAKGIKAGYSPSQYFNEATYLSNNADVKALVKGQAGINPTAAPYFNSGLEHFLLYGLSEAIAGNSTRAMSMSPVVYELSSSINSVVGSSGVTNTITGADGTLNAGDNINGGTANLATMNYTMGNSTTGAAVIANVGTINITSTHNSASFTASNVSGPVAINDYNSSNNLAVTGLAVNPTSFGVNGVTSAATFTATMLDSVLSGNNKAVNVAVSGAGASTSGGVGPQLTLNNTATGFYKTINVASNGSAQNYLDVGTGLGGSALIGATALNITGAAALKMGLASGVNAVRTIVAAPVADVTLLNTTLGTAGSGVDATFNSAGSRLALSGTAIPAGNSIKFTGTGNTLALKATAADSAVLTSSIASQLTNCDSVSVLDSFAAKTLNMSYLGSAVKNVTLEVAAAGTATISNLVNNSTVNVGLDSAAPVAVTTLTTNQLTSGGTFNVNVKGNGAGATIGTLNLNGAANVNLNYSTTITSGTSAVTTLASDVMSSLVVAGGHSGSAVTLGTLPSVTASLDARNLAASSLTVTANNIPTTIRGSLSAPNTITGGTNVDTLYGGAGADTFDGLDGVNVMTGHVVAGATDINTYKFTKPTAVSTITDFNPGTSTTSVDLVHFKSGANAGSLFVGGCVTGAGTVAAGTSALVANNLFSYAGTAATLTSTAKIILYTGAANTASGLQTIVQANLLTTSGGASFGGTTGMPLVYVHTDGNVHLAAVVPSNASTTTAATVTDFAILQGVTSLTNLDASDFAYIA